MTKIGTVHVEVKPMRDIAAWEKVCEEVEDLVAEAVTRGVARGLQGALEREAKFAAARKGLSDID